MAIPIIDLFAGPGGLGEGFTSLKREDGTPAFEIKLSIEKDSSAHKTLTLRSFLRQFIKTGRPIPRGYYEAISVNDRLLRETQIENLYRQHPFEFTEACTEAQRIELGKEPSSIVDEKISHALASKTDWVLIGGPPCQAYSLVGRARNQWGDNLDNDDPRVHLYKEYLRIIAAHQPAVFVMENVKGLLSAKINGEKVFDWIKKDLRNPSSIFPSYDCPEYEIYSFTKEEIRSDRDYVIKSEDYGVPQKRHRVILLGIRKGFTQKKPRILETSNQVSVSEAIEDLPRVRSSFGRKAVHTTNEDGKALRIYKRLLDSDIYWESEVGSFMKELSSLNGLSSLTEKTRIKSPEEGVGGEYLERNNMDNQSPLNGWYADANLSGVLNHQSRSHLHGDIKRYIFCAIYSEIYKRSPRLSDYIRYDIGLLPSHKNVNSGKFNDRFRVQLRNKPATTITSHISKDGHYFIHYDYHQCRSFTVREAARIQTFPDNYLFCGNRTQQYHQVGNAVPPYLAFQISALVLDLF